LLRCWQKTTCTAASHAPSLATLLLALHCCTATGRRPHGLVFNAPSSTKSFSLAGPYRVSQTRWVACLGWK
jgi:hypothetical protein